MNEVSLHLWLQDAIDPAAAILASAGLLGTNAVALVYGPQRCTIARLSGALLTDALDAPLDLAPVYELRTFGDGGELRWWNDTARACGRAAFLSEGATGPSKWDAALPRRATPHRNRYLLWGQSTPGHGPAAGWANLTAERIGSLPVPLSGFPEKRRVRLRTVEYIGDAAGVPGERHGNRVVLAERFEALEVAPSGGEPISKEMVHG